MVGAGTGMFTENCDRTVEQEMDRTEAHLDVSPYTNARCAAATNPIITHICKIKVDSSRGKTGTAGTDDSF